MDQAVRRRGDEGTRDLNGDRQRGFHAQRAFAPHERLERFTLDQLHRVVAAIVFRRGAKLKNTRHIGMLQGGRDARLSQETLARRRPAIRQLGTSITLSATSRCNTWSRAR